MNRFLVLLRGINVGGKNIVPMASLAGSLKEMGFSDVSTYIASGNVILHSGKGANQTRALIEAGLLAALKFDDELIKVLVLSRPQLQGVIDNKPKGFGEQPAKYHSDAIFLIDISVAEALSVFSPRDGVDKVWPGHGVIYSQRLSAQRTKSRLNRIVATPAYKSMTIRSWNTTTRLLDLMVKD